MHVLVNIDFESTVPLYKQLYEGLKEAIEQGRLKPGDRMPPTRDLAKQLRLSRVTVLRCYRDLLVRGYLEAGHGLGTRVSRQLPDELSTLKMQTLSFQPALEHAPIELSAFVQRVLGSVTPVTEDNDAAASVKPDLPLKQWRQVLTRAIRDMDASAFVGDNEVFGYRPLREQIASLFGRMRAVRCTADQVILCSGSHASLDLIARALIDPGNAVAVENPSPRRIRDLYRAHGATISAVAVDDGGLIVGDLRQKENIKLVHVTPSHHNPTGVSMPVARRIELLQWARGAGATIIEDDFDCAFMFGGQAKPAIQGIDDKDGVIYHADFGSILAPLSSFSFIVVPPQLVKAFEQARRVAQQECSFNDSIALTDFIASGQLELHLRHLRDSLQRRRQALMYSLAVNFRKLVSFGKETTGTHLMVTFNDDYLTDRDYLDCAAKCELDMVSTAPFYETGAPVREFLVPFAYADAEVLASRVEFLAGLIAAYEVAELTEAAVEAEQNGEVGVEVQVELESEAQVELEDQVEDELVSAPFLHAGHSNHVIAANYV